MIKIDYIINDYKQNFYLFVKKVISKLDLFIRFIKLY